ncbi:hypothetical protein BT96DRAFT_978474 [Gymnopus androsaceus JB14]|uniref:LysM domain-containing protein n=1 Tax=Gymnopus androsaceus JB14 TaxID=1447944 RepID=A0A6A4H9W1_9AGAR|nr:hypothetical protein BT96DRAFT_978474 [Gymnopus androsaceus JB14]
MFARSSLFALVTALGAIMGARVLAQSSCQATYTVVSGDACVPIAAKFNGPWMRTVITFSWGRSSVSLSLLKGALLSIPVISGDNCQTIAAEFGTTYAALLNCKSREVLCIPAATCSAQYTVKSGDVCISIANQFGITTAELEAANSEIDPLCDNLQVGEVLCIPNEA